MTALTTPRRAALSCVMRPCETNDELVEFVRLRASRYIGGSARDGRVLAAMAAIDRASFLPSEERWAAYRDDPAGIGFGQTCSQPSMVAFMLDKLELGPGLRVLEVGAGCGYAAAIAALLVAPGGSIIAAEIFPELAAAARANCISALATAGLSRRASAGVGAGTGAESGATATLALRSAESPHIVVADASTGLPAHAPFDRIFFSAGVSRRFREERVIAQLAPGGILLYPETHGRLYRVRRRGQSLVREAWEGVAFVPLRGTNA